ncbi:MAG: hypothetical protein ACXVRK_03950 [Gaiellaceae bacterium]
MRFALVLMAGMAAVVLALPVAASFPGRNGNLLFAVVPAQLTPDGLGRGPVHLWAATPLGGISHDLGVVAGNEVEFIDARYTPNGQKVVFLHAVDAPNTPTARYSLDVMNADGSDRRVLVRQPYLAQFAISPDGGTIALLAVVGHSNWAIYLTSIAHPRLGLLHRSGPLGWLQWTTAHTLLVFASVSVCRTGTCRIDTRTQKVQTVPIEARLYRHAGTTPAVSPARGTIAFYSPVGPAGARVYGLDGRLRRNIKGAYHCVGPFSPDGTKIALADWCSGTTQHISAFSFKTHRVQPLDVNLPVPRGGYDRLLDWQALN